MKQREFTKVELKTMELGFWYAGTTDSLKPESVFVKDSAQETADGNTVKTIWVTIRKQGKRSSVVSVWTENPFKTEKRGKPLKTLAEREWLRRGQDYLPEVREV